MPIRPSPSPTLPLNLVVDKADYQPAAQQPALPICPEARRSAAHTLGPDRVFLPDPTAKHVI